MKLIQEFKNIQVMWRCESAEIPGNPKNEEHFVREI